MPYEKLKELIEPIKNQHLWRYIDFPKLAALVQTRKLYFPTLSQLDLNDPWEGFPSKLNFYPDRSIQVTEVSIDRSAESGVSSKTKLSTLKEVFGDRFLSHVESSKEIAVKLRRTFFVNCWHENDTESDSQWRIYGDSPCSLAIVTSFNRLCMSVIDSRKIHGGEVIYYRPDDQSTPDGNAFFPVVHKRQAFSHEKEFRLIYWDPSLLNAAIGPTGVSIDVDLKVLIERIVVSPRAPNWFLTVVGEFLKDLGIPISKSDLLEPFS